MLKNWCFQIVVLEKTPGSPFNHKEIQPVHPKGNQSWIFIGKTDTEAEAPIFWPPDTKNWLTGKDPNTGQGVGAEGDDRRWDGWMASPTRWTWVWVNSGSWWWTGRPVMLRFMGLQRVRHDWETELNWGCSSLDRFCYFIRIRLFLVEIGCKWDAWIPGFRDLK